MRALILVLALGCHKDDDGSSGKTKCCSEDPIPSADAGPDLVGFVGEDLVFAPGPSSVGVLTWTFGDGETTEGQTVVHAYDGPGHYTAFVEATGSGPPSTDSLSVLITWPPLDPPPRSASVMVQANDTLYVAMPDFDKIAVVSLDGAVEHWDTCDEPRTLSTDGSLIAVACIADDSIQIFETSGVRISDIVLRWGARPYGVAMDFSGYTYITMQGLGAVAMIGPGWTFAETIWVDDIDLRGAAMTPDGLIMTRHRSSDDGGSVIRMGAGGIQYWSLALDPGPDSDTNARGVPTYLQQVAVRPDGRVAVFPGMKANIERGLARDGLPLTFETTVRSDLRQISLVADEGPVGEELEAALFDDRGLAVAAAFSPAGDWLYVAHQGMETVDILDAYTMERAGAAVDVGTSPNGLWATDEHLWVSVGLDRELVRYDLDNIAIPVESLRVDLLPASGEILDPQVLLGKKIFQRSVDPRMSSGGYASCASCHLDGDHDRRVWDFTDRGEGLRNTVAMKGRGGAAPIHWSANFDEIQDFEHDIRGPQQGLGFLSEEDWEATGGDTLGASKAGLSEELDALAAYAASLDTYPRSPFRTEDGRLTVSALLGQSIFEDPTVGCAVCHSGPEFTDSGWIAAGVPILHDVGTITADSGQRLSGPLLGIDTPGLRGVHSSPPYLHDGSAATLMEVLVDRNPADEHGVTSGLSLEELENLESYLLQLE